MLDFPLSDPSEVTPDDSENEGDYYQPAWIMNTWSAMLDETRNREMREVAWGAPPGWLEEPNNQSPPLDVRDWYPVNWSGFHAEQQPILPQPQFNNVPTAMHTRHLEVRLAPVGLFKGQMIYGAPGDRVPSPVNVHNSEKRKHESQQDEERPYIPKPPNAFMLFMKEQRPYVLATHKSTDSATVNMIIGRKWRALSENKRDKYYKEAKRLKQLHIQLYPDWSEKENYGQKRKRVRKSGPRDD